MEPVTPSSDSAAPSPTGSGRALVLATLVNRLDILQDVLENAGWDIETCRSPSEALAALRERPFAAVFCDEYLRGASPSGVLAWTRRAAPQASFYLVCMNCVDQAFAGQHRPDELVQFPPTVDSVPKPRAPTETRAAGEASRDVPMEGNTALVPLVDLLEMLGVIGRSAVVALEGGTHGAVYLREGAIVHAMYTAAGGDEIRGLPALAELLALAETDFAVRSFTPPPQRTIHLSTANAITEAARIFDVRNRNRAVCDAIEAAFPQVGAMAIGYALSQQPAYQVGAEADEIFAKGQSLLKRSTEVLGRTLRLSTDTGDAAYAMIRFGDDNLAVATGPAGSGSALLAAMADALRASER